MKKIKQFIVLLTVALLAVTCKKEHAPTSTVGTPEFYFNGTVNGVSTSLNAGVNSYYMYSSYAQDSNNVYSFIGNLKQTTSAINSIEIDINDYKTSASNASINPDSSLKSGSYLYYSAVSTYTTYNVQFTSSYTGGTAQTYTWTFGDGSTSNLANPAHTYSAMGIYNVCLTISGTAGVSNVCNNINLSSPYLSNRKTNISTTSNGNIIYFNASVLGFTPNRYTWNFGDGGSDTSTITNSSNSSINHLYANPGLYQIRLVVEDSLNSMDSIVTYYNAPTASYSVAAANFNISSVTTVTNTSTSLRFSDVTVKWIDASGISYTSNNNAPQPAGSYFNILSETAYQNNINGQLTRKLHVQFSCTLYCAGHAPIQITNGDAVIAVAYK